MVVGGFAEIKGLQLVFTAWLLLIIEVGSELGRPAVSIHHRITVWAKDKKPACRAGKNNEINGKSAKNFN
jgi:hypothetical protein